MDAGELRMGPLVEQLAHHPAFGGVHRAVHRITAIPVRHSQAAIGPQHPQQLIGKALLVRHVRTGFHAPYPIELLILQLEIEGIHHLKPAAESLWRQVCGPLDLGRADADAEHIEAVITGQDPGASTDAAAHIQHPAAGWKLIETTPSHQLMHKGFLGLAEINGSRGIAVMAQVHMIAPEPLQQAVIGPGVVGRGDTVSGFVAPIAAQPDQQGRGSGGPGDEQQSSQHQASSSLRSISTVLAAS